MAPGLNISLYESGKSRADLWDFAAIAAVEFGIESNNLMCDGNSNNNPKKQCNQFIGNPACRVSHRIKKP